jgi:putative DNA primase/helicase
MYPDHQLFEKLSKHYSLIRVKGKCPIEKEWQKYCHTTRSFLEINFQPGENAGIACGPASRVLVVDIDDEDLFKKICAEKGWPITETRTHRTGGGGRHLLYSYPTDGKRYGNKLLKNFGFDIKGDAGQVVAPGSIHPITGKQYTVENDLPMAEAPEWLKELCCDEPPISASKMGTGPTSTGTKNHIDPAEILNGVSEGERNDKLFKYACSLCAQRRPKEEIAVLILTAARECSPPFPEAEALVVVESAWKYASQPQITAGASSSSSPGHRTLDDIGNAERLIDRYGENLRYCHKWKEWLIWDGKRFACDENDKIIEFAKVTVREIHTEAARETDDNRRTSIGKHANRSQSIKAINSLISLAKSCDGIPVSPLELNVNEWLYNVNNGTLDLKTGCLLPHERSHLITKIAPVVYDPNATCPKWEAFLDKIMAGDQEMVAFLHRMIGYTLTGSTSEQCLFFLYGQGANGKSTFLEVIRALLGEYARQADFSTFIQRKSDAVRNDIAALEGARMVTAVEVEDGKQFAESLVKQMTGGDTVTARFLFKENFEFKPQGKIWLAANHKPQIKGTEHAIWRRIHLIPFEVQIPETERIPDYAEELKTELPGILNLALAGCLDWQKNGIQLPKKVKDATAAYRAEMDNLEQFIKESCSLNPTANCTSTSLYSAYRQWCDDNGENQMDVKTFTRRMLERRFEKKRGSGGYFWEGIGLISTVAALAAAA